MIPKTPKPKIYKRDSVSCRNCGDEINDEDVEEYGGCCSLSCLNEQKQI